MRAAEVPEARGVDAARGRPRDEEAVGRPEGGRVGRCGLQVGEVADGFELGQGGEGEGEERVGRGESERGGPAVCGQFCVGGGGGGGGGGLPAGDARGGAVLEVDADAVDGELEHGA